MAGQAEAKESSRELQLQESNTDGARAVGDGSVQTRSAVRRREGESRTKG